MKLEGKVGGVQEPSRILREGDLGIPVPALPYLLTHQVTRSYSSDQWGCPGLSTSVLEVEWRLPLLGKLIPTSSLPCHILPSHGLSPA